jgi:hypothetical protein
MCRWSHDAEVLPTGAVLIVDRDLGFVFWLGQVLDNAGYYALPAKSIADASALLDHFKLEIDLLIVNQSSEGADGFVDALRRQQGHLKVIAVIDESGEPSSDTLEADVSRFKPLNADRVSGMRWLQMIQSVLEQPGSDTLLTKTR